MNGSKTRLKFDNRLFGQVHPKLGWDKKCKCKYYLEWKSKQKEKQA